jgi:hypothetical protein
MKTAYSANAMIQVFLAFLLVSVSQRTESALVAHWPFDEISDSILLDASNNGNTAYIHTAIRSSGITGGALSFDGKSDYAYALNSASLCITSQITIECWVNLRQIEPVSGSGQTIIRKEKAYAIGIGSGGKVGLQICDPVGVWHGGWTLSQQSVTASQWYHIAGVWDGHALKIYVNGMEDPAVFSYNGPGPSATKYTYNAYIGQFFESKYENLNGTLDELKIYNHALSQDSILAHYIVNRLQPPVELIPCVPNPTYNSRPVLSWHANSSISVYRLQVSSNSIFTSVITALPLLDTSYAPVSDFPYGTIYWRVCDDADTSVWSGISSVAILDSNVPAVIPITPDPTHDARPIFRWHPVTAAVSYSIQISTNSDFSTLFTSDMVSDTFYVPSINLPFSIVYWRVGSNPGLHFSAPDTFLVISDSIPILIPVEPDTQSSRRPLFAWHPAAGASLYRIEIDTLGSFLNPYITLPLTDTTYSPSVDLPGGKIFWRVSAGNNTTGYSQIDTFVFARVDAAKPSSRRFGALVPVTIHRLAYGLSADFRIDKPGSVSLHVFSPSGTCLRSIDRENLPAGEHTIWWNGAGSDGKRLPCGVYLAIFKINNRIFAETTHLIGIFR